LDLPMSFLLPSMMTTIVPWSISNARFNKMAHPEVCMSMHRVWKPLHQQKNQWYDPAIDHFRERSSKHFCILVSQLQYVVKKDLNQHCMHGNCTFNRVMMNLLMEQLDKDGKTIGLKNCSHSINATQGYCTQSMYARMEILCKRLIISCRYSL
jgi:hypothetical protein